MSGSNPDPNFELAIVGLGPRGHYALERFIHELAGGGVAETANILLFEETNHLGNGPVWDMDQTESNWSNINERLLDLPSRPKMVLGAAVVEGFPGYHDWAGYHPRKASSDLPDVYPPRKLIGAYLHERFETLLRPLLKAGIVQLVHERVEAVALSETGCSITTRSGTMYFSDQVLLTVGHQPTRQDPQIKGWHADISAFHALSLFEDPYPVAPILDAIEKDALTSIAIRGYGLATIDIARAIAKAHGSFALKDALTRQQAFTPSEQGTLSIVPFSLDGLPMGPKPISDTLDRQFAPPEDALKALGCKLSDAEQQARASERTFLLDAITPLIANVFRALNNKRDDAPESSDDLHRLIKAWIDDPVQDHSCFVNTAQPPIDLLNDLLRMAVGAAPVSLDYCIGQVWRHCHPTIYKALSHGSLKDDVLAEIIFTDEAMKRYAFGPPAESLQQLVALYDAGVLNLNHLTDPDIAVTEQSWELSSGEERATARIMINAVLDAPKIADIRSPLIEGLLNDGHLAPVHDDLGVATARDGSVMSKSGDVLPIAVLGRLAKGTIIGVDAILECFGERPRAWATSAGRRAEARLGEKL